MAKYEPLRRYLRQQRGAAVDLASADIERIIQAMLPKAANDPSWWRNTATRARGYVQCHAWLDAGYHAITGAHESVLFVPASSMNQPVSLP